MQLNFQNALRRRKSQPRPSKSPTPQIEIPLRESRHEGQHSHSSTPATPRQVLQPTHSPAKNGRRN